MTAEPDGGDALDGLYWRAEILQALFWMRGEELATEVTAARLGGYLVADAAVVARQIGQLVADGYLEEVVAAEAGPPRYCLTPLGVTEGGRSFRDEFEGMTRLAHYQCAPGCWCLDPKHAGEPCPSEGEHAHGA